MASLPLKLQWPQAETRWASQLNPVLSFAPNNGILLTGVSLAVGDNTINHKLQRPLQGYIITGMQGGYSQVYDVPSQFPELNLVLHSSAAVTVSLWCF